MQKKWQKKFPNITFELHESDNQMSQKLQQVTNLLPSVIRLPVIDCVNTQSCQSSNRLTSNSCSSSSRSTSNQRVARKRVSKMTYTMFSLRPKTKTRNLLPTWTYSSKQTHLGNLCSANFKFACISETRNSAVSQHFQKKKGSLCSTNCIVVHHFVRKKSFLIYQKFRTTSTKDFLIYHNGFHFHLLNFRNLEITS